ncbi:sucrose-specific PTS transporter subunit IIBC [Vibrio sp. JC009]|uniref:sucrose-specific PTS transporter subunit IIBC n=1 Tax=Vibrio sp. JC009 TaxID=2912314 RepID=UPI0023AF7C7D|nr:sucrose-specific PTS transporter subunit IIBC [Vibrio sp. JC009]WED20869.1 sucrose-specific PTS transporter subunit IIBC [Vibrio sp. JC009]
MSYAMIAEELVGSLGGKENIISVAHCATRLRVMVADENKIDKDSIEDTDKVKGTFFNSGQYQIIFGTGTVNRVFEAIEGLNLSTSSKSEIKQASAEQGTAIQRAIRTFSDVFVPLIPALVATGLFMGLRGLVTRPEVLAVFGLTPEAISANFILYTQILTDTAFIFLPAMVAWSASRVFGGTPLIGLVLGLMLVSPALPNAWAVGFGNAEPLLFFGFIPVVGYQGSVIPAFIAGWLTAKLERRIRSVMPEAFDLVMTPFLTLLIMSAASLLIIGPLFHIVEVGMVDATKYLLDLPLGLSGLFIGFVWDLIVVTGVHHVFNLLEIQLLANEGSNVFNGLITGAISAQGAACLAVGMKSKSKKMKALAFPSTVSAFLGIIEPAIFGVNLRYYRPFVFALIGGALGGFTAQLVGLAASGMAVTVIPGTLLYLDGQLMSYFLVHAVSCGVAFSLTYMFGYSDKMLEKK